MTIELSLASILANVVANFGNTELNYISDFKIPGTLSLQMFASLLQSSINYFSKTEQSNLLGELAKLDIPVWQYEQSALRKRQIDEFLPVVCPIFETEYFISSPSMGCVVVHMRTQ